MVTYFSTAAVVNLQHCSDATIVKKTRKRKKREEKTRKNNKERSLNPVS
jgi:hypothetical protein